MKFFSGFCLQNEQELFGEWIINNDFTICGFSFGAQKAVEYALSCQTRIDKIQLFSPAYFNDKDEKFKRLQLMFFGRDKDAYIQNFLVNTAYPKELNLQKYLRNGTFEELQELLYYKWEEGKLLKLKDKNIKIEVYIGELDKIVEAQKACEFFKNFGEVYFIKKKGHILSPPNK